MCNHWFVCGERSQRLEIEAEYGSSSHCCNSECLYMALFLLVMDFS